jgi:hypothetical protein
MTVIGNNCRIHGPYVTGNIAPSCPSCWGLKAKPDPPPCPDCASLLSRLTVEGMAKVMCYMSCVGDAGIIDAEEYVEGYWKRCPQSVQDTWLERARALRSLEGK